MHGETNIKIPRHIVGQYIKQCERCTEKLRKKEVGPGIVVKPITVNEPE
jgi:hypothetical protein